MSTFVLSYILGPFLAFLPARWRAIWFGNYDISWRAATILSGVIEFVVGPFLLLIISALVQQNVSTNLANLAGHGNGAQIGGEAFTLFSLTLAALNPLVWFGFYIIFEGAARAFMAVTTGEMAGTLPLFLLDRAYLYGQRQIWKTAPPLVPDQITNNISHAGWFLKIESCRMPRGWDVGRLLLYKDQYYRIASFSHAQSPRPYVFLLSSVPAGVRTRTVILYSPDTIAPEPLL